MPDERRAKEQDLFNRAALVWRIERRTKIGLSHREPKPVLEGSMERENRGEEIGENSVHYHKRCAGRQSSMVATPADVRGSSWETAGTKEGDATGASRGGRSTEQRTYKNTQGRGGGLTDSRLSGRFIIRPVRRIMDYGGTTASRRPESGGDSSSSTCVPASYKSRGTRLRLTHLGVGHRHLLA